MAILRADNISIRFDNRQILSNISLSLQEGQWLGILGESGSGKSTLLRIIARMIDSDEGNVTFLGEELPAVSTLLIAGHPQMRMIAQDYQLFPEQTAAENIAYSMRFMDPDYRAERLEELLTLSQLQNVRNQKAKKLSGGEKQRVAIATALAAEPAILILDEPFAHLDAVNKQTMIQVIASLRHSENLACIFVTHDPAEALAWSDEIIILKDGQILQQDTPERIYKRPTSSHTALLTGKVNWLNKGKTQLIRPEFVKVTHKNERSLHQLEILECWFSGPYYEYLGKDANGLTMNFFRLKNDIKRGQKVMVTYDKKEVITLQQ